MPTFSPGDIVRVPFPYTDRTTRQHRPALVVSKGGIGDQAGLLWVLMITSAANRCWPDDIAIGTIDASGLSAPSVIRPSKIATIEIRYAEPIGRVAPSTLDRVMRTVQSFLAH